MAGPFHNLVGSSRCGLDVDVSVRKFAPVEEALGLAAIRTPRGGVNGDFQEVRF